MHEHFDANDVRTGYTIITRESAWDDESRTRALALAEYENSICGCGCNLPAEVSYDKDQVFMVDKVTCRAGKALAQVVRKEREANEKAPDGWADGLRHYVIAIDDDRPAPQVNRGGVRGD